MHCKSASLSRISFSFAGQKTIAKVYQIMWMSYMTDDDDMMVTLIANAQTKNAYQ